MALVRFLSVSVFSEQPSMSLKKLMLLYSHFHGGALDVRRISSGHALKISVTQGLPGCFSGGRGGRSYLYGLCLSLLKVTMDHSKH